MTQIGKNIEYDLKGSKLTIVIDVSKENGTSTTGKSTTVATTSGNKVIALPGGGQVSLGVNCYKPKAD